MKHMLWFLAAVLAALAVGCGGARNKKAELPRPIPTTTLRLHTIDMPETYVADIQGVQFVEIRPRVEGFIETIFVDEGQKVHKGDKLFQISSAEYGESVREAKAHLKQAEAEYQMAAYERSRIGRLVSQNIISSIRLKQADSQLEVAELRVEQARAQLKRSLVSLNYTIISAPCNGYVNRITNKVGSLVNVESLLTSISDISEVFAYYKMNEADYLRYKRIQIKDNQDTVPLAKVELILPDGSTYEHRGQIETVEGDFERGTGSIAFRARFPNPQGLLRHGVTGKINMTTRLTDVLLVPQQSTFEIQEFTYVYLVDKQGKARIRSFRPAGRYNGFYVTQDFEPGTRIVYSGTQSVKDGMAVIPEEQSFQTVEQQTVPKAKTPSADV